MKTESIVNYLFAIKDIEDCTELTINRFDITGRILFVDLNDLYYLPNIEILTLCNLTLNEKEMKAINSLNKLNKLELLNCDFDDNDTIKYLNDIKSKELLIDNTKIDFNVIKRKYEKIIIKNMELNGKINCNILDINKAIVNFNNIDLDEIDTIILSKSQYNLNELSIESYKGKKHLIIMNEQYDEIEVEYEKN